MIERSNEPATLEFYATQGPLRTPTLGARYKVTATATIIAAETEQIDVSTIGHVAFLPGQTKVTFTLEDLELEAE